MSSAELVKDFIEKVQWIHEVEYGDFKRKLGLYINRLDEKIPREQQTAAFRSTIEELRTRLLFAPTGELEATREEAIELGEKLLSSLQ